MLPEDDLAAGQLISAGMDRILDGRASLVRTHDLVRDRVDPAHRRYAVFDRETLGQDKLVQQA